MRDLHLYVGFFISPFVVVFAVSVFFLVRSGLSTVRTQPIDNALFRF